MDVYDRCGGGGCHPSSIGDSLDGDSAVAVDECKKGARVEVFLASNG